MKSEHEALVLESGKFLVRSLPTPSPGPGDLLVAPLFVGVCGTDLDIARGSRVGGAAVLGHEGIAAVVAVGSEVMGFHEGQYVVFNPVDPASPRRVLGHSVDGLLQQRFLVRGADVSRGLVQSFKAHVPPVAAALAEPLATVIYGQSLVRSIGDQNAVLVVGAGPVGVMHATYARLTGTTEVLLVDPDTGRLQAAVRRGVISPHEAVHDEKRLTSIVRERTGGRGVDALYLCTPRAGAVSALRHALTALSSGGCIDLVVGFDDEARLPELRNARLNDFRWANTCGKPTPGAVAQIARPNGSIVRLTGHRGTSARHLSKAMNHLERHQSMYSSVISHVSSLGDAPRVLSELLSSPGVSQVEGAICTKLIVNVQQP